MDDEKPNTPEQIALNRAQRGLMSVEDQKVFDSIVALSPESLNQYQINYLNARRGYLTQDQRRIFGDVLRPEGVTEKDEEQNGEEELKVNTAPTKKEKVEDKKEDTAPSEALVNVATDLGIDTEGKTTEELKEEIKRVESEKSS